MMQGRFPGGAAFHLPVVAFADAREAFVRVWQLGAEDRGVGEARTSREWPRAVLFQYALRQH